MAKLSNPIIEVMLEIGLTYHFPSEAIVGILFNLLHDENEKVALTKLPIANIPIEVRSVDPNLKNKPTHQIVCKDGVIQIGEKTLCVGVHMPYISWENYEWFIRKIWNLLIEKNLVKGINGVRLRYLNFYDTNIYDTINLRIYLGDNRINYISTILKTEFPCADNIVGGLQITNGVHVKNPGLGLDDDGSLIDIQTFTQNVSVDNIQDVIGRLHEQVELLFNNLTKVETNGKNENNA